jgi:mono/diheme cytochrome c family protein
MLKRGLLFMSFSSLTVILVAAVLSAQEPNNQIETGRYLVERVAMCVECHTPRDARGKLDRTRLLKGAPIPLKSPFRSRPWAFQAPAIAGLPGWSSADTVTLLTTGHRPSGESPKPPMPPYRMSRKDAEAVVAYLTSLR